MKYLTPFLILCLINAQLFANRGYVTNKTDNSVYVFDTTTNATIGGPIPLPGIPNLNGIALSPDGHYLYISSTSGADNYVTIIDTETDSVVASTVPVGVNPLFLSVTPNGERVFVSNIGDLNLTAIIYNNNLISTSLPIYAGLSLLGIAVTPDGRLLYAANPAENTLTILDVQTTAVLATINGGTTPVDIVITSNGKTAYVTNGSANTLTIIDIPSNTIVDTINVLDDADFVGLSPDESRVYFTQSNGYRIFYPTTRSISAQFLGANDVAGFDFEPSGTVGYFITAGHVDVVATATNTVTATLFGGFQITSIAIKGAQTPSSFTGKQKSNTIGIASRPVNKFSWQRSGASSLAGYYLRRNGELIATLDASALSFTDKTFNSSQPNVYTLAAFDAQGNIGIPASVTIGRN